VYTLGLLVAAHVVPGLRLDGLASALVAGLLLGLVNAIVRPVLVVLTFPITLLTLGLFLLVLNAFCLRMTSWLVSGLHVDGFWAAVLGAVVISLVSWVLTAFVSDSGRLARMR